MQSLPLHCRHHPVTQAARRLAMAHTTMKTFFQGGTCFGYHSDATGNKLGTPPGTDGFTGGLSHIWAPILPLFP